MKKEGKKTFQNINFELFFGLQSPAGIKTKVQPEHVASKKKYSTSSFFVIYETCEGFELCQFNPKSILDQSGSIQNLQMFPIAQTRNWSGTFFWKQGVVAGL